MNQPTREEFEEFKQELKEEVWQLREQRTEEMKVMRIEFDPGGIQNRLDNHVEMMKEQDEMLTKIYTDVGKANTEIALLRSSVEGVKADIKAIKESQADFRDALKDLKTAQDRQELMLQAILSRLPPKS